MPDPFCPFGVKPSAMELLNAAGLRQVAAGLLDKLGLAGNGDADAAVAAAGDAIDAMNEAEIDALLASLTGAAGAKGEAA